LQGGEEDKQGFNDEQKKSENLERIFIDLSSRPPQAGKSATADPAKRTGFYAVVDTSETNSGKILIPKNRVRMTLKL
jgi:hypothetical protein